MILRLSLEVKLGAIEERNRTKQGTNWVEERLFVERCVGRHLLGKNRTLEFRTFLNGNGLVSTLVTTTNARFPQASHDSSLLLRAIVKGPGIIN